MELRDFGRFYFEIYLEDGEDPDNCEMLPEKHICYDDGRQTFVIERYVGDNLYAGEYETGFFRRTVRDAEWVEEGEIPADQILGLLASLDERYAHTSEEDIPLCDEAGHYCCSVGMRRE